jgi:hypothetical protein
MDARASAKIGMNCVFDFVSADQKCYHHEFGGNVHKTLPEAERFMLQFSLNKTQLAQTTALKRLPKENTHGSKGWH